MNAESGHCARPVSIPAGKCVIQRPTEAFGVARYQRPLVRQAHGGGQPFDGDASKFRLGVEAMRLGLAYEYDPYFSLSIARMYPLPHQLAAVYDYFIKLPRIG